MLTTLGWTLSIIILVSSPRPLSAADQSRSASVARQLAAALSAQKMDAIAAKDPDEPGRFVAALFFPDAQLLVVSAQYAAPPLLEAKLAQKQFRDIYSDLQGAAVPKSSIFFQDVKADGLCTNREEPADILYDGSQTPKVFDGDRDKGRLSAQAYEQQFAAADEQYSRLLQVLLAQVQSTS
jgi:hypothetical protein